MLQTVVFSLTFRIAVSFDAIGTFPISVTLLLEYSLFPLPRPDCLFTDQVGHARLRVVHVHGLLLQLVHWEVCRLDGRLFLPCWLYRLWKARQVRELRCLECTNTQISSVVNGTLDYQALFR